LLTQRFNAVALLLHFAAYTCITLNRTSRRSLLRAPRSLPHSEAAVVAAAAVLLLLVVLMLALLQLHQRLRRRKRRRRLTWEAAWTCKISYYYCEFDIKYDMYGSCFTFTLPVISSMPL
jgi:hypothetical protein